MFNNRKMGSSDSLLNAIKDIMEKKHTTPETPKEKSLAKLAHPKDKITHKDVLVGRGVLKKENSGDRMGVIVGTRKEKVEIEPKLKEGLDEAASFRVPAHVKKHLEDKHGPAQTILVSKDGSKIQHVVRHHDDDGADYYETRTHEYNGTAPIKDRKVGKLIKHVKPKIKEEVELEEGRGRPRKNPLPAGQEPAGDDTHKHPMQQLEKISHAIEGNEPHFEHKDGSKSKVTKHLAKHIVAIHNSMRTSQEKDNFAQKVHANRESMKSEVSKHF